MATIDMVERLRTDMGGVVLVEGAEDSWV